MAIVQNPIIGRAKGSVANNTFTKWKTKNVWKSKALTVSNPQTDAQMYNRSKFSLLVHLGSILLSVIRIGFKEISKLVTTSNSFQSINMINDALVYNVDHFEVDYSKLVLSRGSLENTAIGSASATNGSATATVAWNPAPNGSQSNGDKACIVILDEENKGMSLMQVDRNAGTANITLDANATTGDTMHVYLFFSSADKKYQSDSVYMAITV